VRLVKQRTVQCERTRGWVSLALDGELSEFERTLMNAHVARCEDCAVFASEIGAIAGSLREAAFEPLAVPVRLPMRRHVRARSLQIGAAAALIVGAIGLASLASGGAAPPTAVPRAHVKPALLAMSDDETDQLLRQVRLQTLRPQRSLGYSRKLLDIPI